MTQASVLKRQLDTILETYQRRTFLHSDPISIPHRYKRPVDQEMTGFLSAMMAFGSVKSMLPALDKAVGWLGEDPVSRLLAANDADVQRETMGFQYRWVRQSDLHRVLMSLRKTYGEGRTLEGLFKLGYQATDADTLAGMDTMLTGLRMALPEGSLEHYGTRYLIPGPGGNGARKRVHMFLRWMVRKDAVDLGLWSTPKAKQCIIPLDTHVARIARLLGLSDRRSMDGRMAREITDKSREFDPSDPVKYDFAISRLGILGVCPSKRDTNACRPCELRPSCRHWNDAA